MDVTFKGSIREILEQITEFVGAIGGDPAQMTLPIPAAAKPAKTVVEKKRLKDDTIPPAADREPTKTEVKKEAAKIEGAKNDGENVAVAPKISKENLTDILQKIMAKEVANDPSKKAAVGVQKVREILSRFGINRIGELEEKRYHEFKTFAEQELNA